MFEGDEERSRFLYIRGSGQTICNVNKVEVDQDSRMLYQSNVHPRWNST